MTTLPLPWKVLCPFNKTYMLSLSSAYSFNRPIIYMPCGVSEPKTGEKWGSHQIGDACRSVGRHGLDAGHACGQECAKCTPPISGTRIQGRKGDFILKYDHMPLRKSQYLSPGMVWPIWQVIRNVWNLPERKRERKDKKEKSKKEREKKIKAGFTFFACFTFCNGRLNVCIECFTSLRPNEQRHFRMW